MKLEIDNKIFERFKKCLTSGIREEAEFEAFIERKVDELHNEVTMERNEYRLCDNCQKSITEAEYLRNKGLCNECVANIN